MSEAKLQRLSEHVLAKLGPAITSSHIKVGELTVWTTLGEILRVLKTLRDDPGCKFEVLLDICGVDFPEREKRFDVVYHLLSVRLNQRIRVKLETNEEIPVPSAVELFPTANWYEREAYDMYGIL